MRLLFVPATKVPLANDQGVMLALSLTGVLMLSTLTWRCMRSFLSRRCSQFRRRSASSLSDPAPCTIFRPNFDNLLIYNGYGSNYNSPLQFPERSSYSNSNSVTRIEVDDCHENVTIHEFVAETPQDNQGECVHVHFKRSPNEDLLVQSRKVKSGHTAYTPLKNYLLLPSDFGGLLPNEQLQEPLEVSEARQSQCPLISHQSPANHAGPCCTCSPNCWLWPCRLCTLGVPKEDGGSGWFLWTMKLLFTTFYFFACQCIPHYR